MQGFLKTIIKQQYSWINCNIKKIYQRTNVDECGVVVSFGI